MTREREEAIEILNQIYCDWRTDEEKEAIELAIKALVQGPVIDKIRAEVDEQYDRVHPYNISCAQGLEMALQIIDKYKEEMR